MVLAVLVNSSPVIGIIFSEVIEILFKLIFNCWPSIESIWAAPITTPSLLSSTLASKVGVLIVIDPSANTAKVLTVADNNSSPVIIKEAVPVTVSSPWDVINSSPLIIIGALAVAVILLAVVVNSPAVVVENTLPLPVSTNLN